MPARSGCGEGVWLNFRYSPHKLSNQIHQL
nr:MAG TPA: hypothetical protein [Caudoviricetes sp.]